MPRMPMLALVLLVLLQAGARADDYAKGMDAYFAGKYKTAFKLLKPAAEAGNALAGYQVGVMYDVGQGVHVNKLAALAWYRIAAESDPRAQVAMAERLMEGRGIAHDQPAAVSWYRKAAAQADLTALLRLAIAYRDGQGVPKDIVLAHVFASKRTGELGHKVLDLVDRQNLSIEIEARLSPEQSAESKTLQNSWTWPMLDELPSSSKTGAVP
jgi:uncharacterized protein